MNLAGVQIKSVVGQTIPGATPNKIAFNALYTIPFEPGKLTLSGSVIWRDLTHLHDDIFNQVPLIPAVEYAGQPAGDVDGRWQSLQHHPVRQQHVFNTNGYDGNGGVLLGTFGGKEDILQEPALNEPRGVWRLQLQVRWRGVDPAASSRLSASGTRRIPGSPTCLMREGACAGRAA